MAGYLIIGGSDEAAWNVVESHSVSKTELEQSGYGLILQREENGKTYTVRDMEPLTFFLSESSNHQKYCVIPHAESLSVVVQNKLLKALEDSSVIFFLLSSNQDSILPTVKSRLVKWNLGKAGGEEKQRVQSIFQNLDNKRELFDRLQLSEDKDRVDQIFYKMDVQDFFREVECLFLKALSYLQWKQDTDALAVEITKLWSQKEDVIRVCSICEQYTKKGNLTKDDLFIFVAEITEEVASNANL